ASGSRDGRNIRRRGPQPRRSAGWRQRGGLRSSWLRDGLQEVLQSLGRVGAICQLKNFRAPGCFSSLEDRVRQCNGTGEQLLNPQSACQLAPGKTAQVHRAEGADIAGQAGSVVSALDTLGTNPPAAGIPGTKFIDHVDDQGARSRVRTRL